MHVLVTTAHKGVFVGHTDAEVQRCPEQITLTDCRMGIYWGTERGLAQLAAEGPTKNTRASSMVTAWHLRDVTSVIELSGPASAAWNSL